MLLSRNENNDAMESEFIPVPQTLSTLDFLYFPRDWHHGFLPGTVSSEHIHFVSRLFIFLLTVFDSVRQIKLASASFRAHIKIVIIHSFIHSCIQKSFLSASFPASTNGSWVGFTQREHVSTLATICLRYSHSSDSRIFNFWFKPNS